jgi:hypothetical protein
MKIEKYLLIILLLLNTMVLAGQIWPEGAPPFARTVNIIFLGTAFIYFAFRLTKNN